MRKFSKIAASALALALSVTMVTPITANAEVIESWEKDANGDTITTYTNEDTKESISEKDYTATWHNYDDKIGYYATLSNAVQKEETTIRIATKSMNETIKFVTTLDVAKFSNFKSSKKALKVTVLSKSEYTDPATTKTCVSPDYKDKDGNGYYKNVKGEFVKVEAAKLNTDMPKGEDKASYTLRLYAKKAGTYKLTFDANLKDGTTVKKTYTIIAKDDAAAIKSATYAGQIISTSIDSDKDPINGNRVWTKGFGSGTTTKKSGKFKVTMNKDFKLKKIEVATPIITQTTKKNYNNEDYTVTGYDTEKAKSDLDQVYGDGAYSWKTVKNGKKIKLNKIDESKCGNDYKNYSNIRKGTTTTTHIRITYYDKKNKVTKRVVYTIRLVQK